jgi:nitrate reductase beta subunit
VEVDSKGGVVIEDRNKDSKPEVTFVRAVEVSSVFKGAWVRAWLCKLQTRVHSTRSRK